MNVIYRYNIFQTSVVTFSIPVILISAFIIVVFIYAPYKSSGGHIIKWYKDNPLKYLLIFLAILAVLIAADVFLFVSYICPDINYCTKMNRGGGETVVIKVNDETVSFEDAEYRTKKVGNNIIFTHNGTEITPISILSDEEVSKIKASEYIEIRYGYIENFNEKVSKVWTITSLEAVE